MVRILLSVLQFRVNARYVEANPPFTGIGAPAARCLCVLCLLLDAWAMQASSAADLR